MTAALHTRELTDPAAATDDQFGSAVAVSGDTLVVGSLGLNTAQGVAYVYHRPASGWAHARLVATLLASDGAAVDEFGSAVAISGSTIVVSAPLHTVGSNSQQGALYVFQEPKAGWSGTRHESAELVASDGDGADSLGASSVALSGDTIAASAHNHQVGANTAQGAVYVWVRPKAGWSGTRNQAAELTSSNGAPNEHLGYAAVGVSGDTVIAGTGDRHVNTSDDVGSVYVFVRPTTGWAGSLTQAAELRASDGQAGDSLGYGAATIRGNVVVAGAGYHGVGTHSQQGTAYVWVRPPSGWFGTLTESAQLVASDGQQNDHLGYLGVSMSGRTIAVAAPYRANPAFSPHTTQGAIYLFPEPAGGWAGTVNQSGVEVAPDGGQDDFLGETATAISDTTVVAGSAEHAVGSHQSQGAVYVFAPARPTLSALKQSHHKWRARPRTARLNPAKPPKGGTRFSFSLSQAATVTLHFAKRVHRHRRAAGTLRVAAPQGHNRLYFFGRLARKKALSGGLYTASFSAANSAGSSTHHTLHFTVTARH